MPQRHRRQCDGDIVHVFERQGFDQRPASRPTWVLNGPECMSVLWQWSPTSLTLERKQPEKRQNLEILDSGQAILGNSPQN